MTPVERELRRAAVQNKKERLSGTYPPSSFDRDRMIALIKSVGKRELKQEARIAMRTIDAAWAGEEIADVDLKRINAAAERVVSLKEKRENERAAAVAWLKTKRDKIGLAALADMLEVDAANLGKVIEGRRSPPITLVKTIRVQEKPLDLPATGSKP